MNIFERFLAQRATQEYGVPLRDSNRTQLVATLARARNSTNQTKSNKKIPRQPRQLEFVKLTECKDIVVFTLQSVILKMCTQKWILEKHGKIPPCEKGTEIWLFGGEA